jgi:hypothetical protein
MVSYRPSARLTRRHFLAAGSVVAGSFAAARFGGPAFGAAAQEVVFTTDQLIPLQEQEWASPPLTPTFSIPSPC